MRRAYGRSLSACVFALLVVLAVPVTAAGKAGALDRTFNGDGKLVTVLPYNSNRTFYPEYRLPYEFAAGRIAMASAPGGKLVVANSKAVIEYLANGRRNPRFGGNGAVPIVSTEGSSFRLADIDVDSQGRVLIAGTTKPVGAYGMANLSLPGPIPSVASIERLQADGLPDPTFGDGGVVNTNFEVSPATYKGQSYSGTAVGVVGLAVDQADRPILTGSTVVEVGRCPGPQQSRFERSQAIVARLTVGGAPDPTFAGNGTKSVGGLTWLGSPTVTSNGVLSGSTSADPCPREGPGNPSVLAGLGQDGSIDQSFASSGFWSRPFTRISNFAVSPSGGILLVARRLELKRGNWVESAPTIVGMRADGSVDSGFGHGGRAEPQLPRHAGIAAISTDAKGRILLTGTISHKLRHGDRNQSFLVMRMRANGTPDTDFGRKGRVTTSFGGKAKARASDVLVDSASRIVVGGKLSGPRTHGAFALARYVGEH